MMGGELDPFPLLRRTAGQIKQAAAEAAHVDLLAEVEAMARRLAIGPLFLVNELDEARAAEVLARLAVVDVVDHRVMLRRSPFVERGTLLVITPEARAAAHDVGLTDDLLANPQEGTQ